MEADAASTFAQLVDAHQERIRALVYRLLGWRPDEVEDVVQDVFLLALRNLPRFRGDAAASTWLTRIAINRCRSRQRRRWLRPRWLRASFGDESSRCAHAADADAVRNERLAGVRLVVQGLPIRDREVVVLRYLEELSVGQIAELLSVRKNTVEVRLSRARQRLREKLGELYEDYAREA